MRPLVIFGAGHIGKLAAWYFLRSGEYDFRGFCVEDEYCGTVSCGDARVFPLSSLEDHYPAGSCDIFVALGYQRQNMARQGFVRYFHDKGYNLASCISENAVINNGNSYGYNCFIMENAVLQPFSRIGNNCIIWSGAVVAHEAVIEDNCFLSANCVAGGMSHIGHNTFIGMNSCIRDSIHVGHSCIIGAGATILSPLADDVLASPGASPKAAMPASQALRFIDI